MLLGEKKKQVADGSPILERTPLPVRKIAILVFVFLGDALCFSVVLPFTPFMVESFMNFDEEDEYLVGYYAGAIAGAYLMGQICTAALWGLLSDRIGRRPVLLTCLSLTAVCLVAFGAAPSLAFAFVAWFTTGLCAGSVIVAKSMISDLTDETNESEAFVYVGVTFAGGSILGPLIGGALAEPAEKYPWLPFIGLWEACPYLLPCVVVACFVFVDLAFAFVLLEESNKHNTYSKVESNTYSKVEGQDDVSEEQETPADVKEISSVSELLVDPSSPFSKICCSFVLFGSCFMAFQQVFPIYASASVGEHGGLGLDSTQVGLVQSAGGATTLFGVVLIFPALSRRLGVPRTYCAALISVVVFAYSAPPLIAIYAAYTGHTPWICLILANGFVSLATEISFTSLNIMLKNSAPPHLVGGAIGLGSALGNFGFAIGPLAGGALFAFSSSPNSGLPDILKHGRLFFLVIELVALFNITIVLTLPKWPWNRQQQQS